MPFLAPAAPSPAQSHYAAIPLVAPSSSAARQSDAAAGDDEKLLGLQAGDAFGQAPRRHWLVVAWTYLSPILVLALAASVYLDRRRTAINRSTVVNPYACGPKSNFTTLEAVCRAGMGPERQKVRFNGGHLLGGFPSTPFVDSRARREQDENYELALDRHLTQQQCDAIYPGLYLSVPAPPSSLVTVLLSLTLSSVRREIERARDYWKARGGVTEKDLDEAEEKGQARVQIIKNRVRLRFTSLSMARSG